MKAHTDIEQSKKLAEILPLESADMSFVEKGNAKRTWYDAENSRITTAYEKKYYIPCWSLAALLDVLPILKRIGREKAKPNIYFNVFVEKWVCNSLYYTSDSYDNPVDACYEMILKLHELKML